MYIILIYLYIWNFLWLLYFLYKLDMFNEISPRIRYKTSIMPYFLPAVGEHRAQGAGQRSLRRDLEQHRADRAEVGKSDLWFIG